MHTEQLLETVFASIINVLLHQTSPVADIDVAETLRRPYSVGERTLSVPHLGAPLGAPHGSRHKLTRPTLSHVTLYTAQPAKTTPGHTGFLTFATLPPHSPPTSPPSHPSHSPHPSHPPHLSPPPHSPHPSPPPHSSPPPSDNQQETVTNTERE